MRCQIHVNRHIVNANKKHGKEEPALSISCKLGTIRAKQIEFNNWAKLVQDASRPRSCGATIWLESDLENIIADNVQLDQATFREKSRTPL